MDIFTLEPDTYINGQIVNGIDSILWIERYLENGEFTIVGNPTQQLRTDLAIGTFISHQDTLEVMMVEDHLIDESNADDIKLTITGRSVEAIAMENRVATTNTSNAFGAGSFITDPFIYYINSPTAIPSWEQALQVINDYLVDSINGSPENYTNLVAQNEIMSTEIPIPVRSIRKVDNIYSAVLDILASVNAGIRVERPYGEETTLRFIIHNGQNLMNGVIFDYALGELENARYFWSRKNSKNAAYVTDNTHALQIRPDGLTGFDLRIMGIEANDVSPSGIFSVEDLLLSRGSDAIEALNEQNILDATISKKATRFRYNDDYKLGDWVSVFGNYGVNTVMRVTEYARSSDKDGDSGYPTLSMITGWL